MSTRVSWKCNKSERLSVIPSSYSSGCSSCSASLSGSAAIIYSATISGMSMGSGSGVGFGAGCGAGAALCMWDKLWCHWMGPKYGLSVISPSTSVPLIPIFLRMCVMRKGKGNPHVFVCSTPDGALLHRISGSDAR
jgi:hypothetical protein